MVTDVTIEGESVEEFIEKEKGKEVSHDYVQNIHVLSAQAKQNVRAKYGTGRITDHRWHHRGSGGRGIRLNSKVKIFNEEEINAMNVIATLKGNMKLMYELISNLNGSDKRPVSQSELKKAFLQKYPGKLSAKSSVSFSNIFKKLTDMGLVEVFGAKAGKFFIHPGTTSAKYYVALNYQEMKNGSTDIEVEAPSDAGHDIPEEETAMHPLVSKDMEQEKTPLTGNRFMDECETAIQLAKKYGGRSIKIQDGGRTFEMDF